MFVLDPTWQDLIAAVVGAVLGWLVRHFGPPK